jgi:hypothetical protein
MPGLNGRPDLHIGIDMAKSTGIMLTATAIGMGNEFVQGYGINFRMGIAGLGAALFLTGVESINETAGVGLSVLAFITVMLTPFKGKAPAQEVVALLGNKGQTVTRAQQRGTAPATSPGITII